MKNRNSERVYTTGAPRGFKGLDAVLAVKRLDMLEAAASLGDISPLKSVNLHPLIGNRKGQWAISVNDRWRICFTPEKDGFADVEITDYHNG